MSFTIVDREPGGTSGEISIGLAGEITEYWTIVADGPGYSIEDLRASGIFGRPYVDVHPQNSRLLFRPVKIDQNAENPAYFRCTLTWNSQELTPPEKKEQQQDEDNPLSRPARITIDSAIEKVTTLRDRTGRPKTNSAGDLFDPPQESNEVYLIITVRKNVEYLPAWPFDYVDAINSDVIVIDGRPIPKGRGWLAVLRAGERQIDNGVEYCEAHLELWIKRPREPYGDETESDVPSPWQTEVLDEGLNALDRTDGKVRIKIPDAEDPTKLVYPGAPVPLNGNGDRYDPGTVGPEDYLEGLSYLVFQDHIEMPFSDISFLWS